MAVSLQGQLLALRTVGGLRPADLRSLGIVPTVAQAELLDQQIKAAVKTFERIASDERIRRYLEQLEKKQ